MSSRRPHLRFRDTRRTRDSAASQRCYYPRGSRDPATVGARSIRALWSAQHAPPVVWEGQHATRVTAPFASPSTLGHRDSKRAIRKLDHGNFHIKVLDRYLWKLSLSIRLVSHNMHFLKVSNCYVSVRSRKLLHFGFSRDSRLYDTHLFIPHSLFFFLIHKK